jgi:hypothetical protein
VELKVVKFLKRISSWWLDVMYSREAGMKVDFDLWTVDRIAKYCGDVESLERTIIIYCSKFMNRDAMYKSSARVFESYRNVQSGLAIWCNGPLSKMSRVSVRVDGKVKLIRTYQVLLMPQIVVGVLLDCFLGCDFVISGDNFITVCLPDLGNAKGAAINAEIVKKLKTYGNGLKCDAMVTLQRTSVANKFDILEVVIRVFKMLKDDEETGKIVEKRESRVPGVDENHRSFRQRDRSDKLMNWADASVDDPVEQWGRYDKRGLSSRTVESRGMRSGVGNGLGGPSQHTEEINAPESRQASEGLTFDDQS